MSDIVLSGATRANLLALQNTTAMQSTVQNRLATGKKVITALDNATSFFTAASFTNRSTALTSLLDSISTGIQTMQAANNGITSITKLVAQLRSTAQQALQTTSAFTTQAKILSTAPVSGAAATDIRGNGIAATATATNALTTLTDATKATVAGSATAFTALTSGTSTLTVGDGTTTKTYTYDTATAALPADPTKFKDLATLNARLVADGVKVTADFGGPGSTLRFQGNTTAITAINASEGGGTTVLGITTTTGSATLGDALTISDGTTSKTYTYDSTASGSDGTKFSSIADLNTKLSGAGVKASAADAGGGKLKLTATQSATTLTVSGAAQGSTRLNMPSSIEPTGALEGKTMTFTMSDGTTTNVVFGDPAKVPGAIKTLDDLNTKLAGIGVSATLDGTGAFSFTTTSSTASRTFSISGTATGTGTSFATIGSTSPSRGGSGADSRDALVSQYNGLLAQINTLAKDAGFNGINLLAGDTLSLIFNETNTSRLDIAGTSANADGLGLINVQAMDFNDGNSLNAVLKNVDRVTNMLASQATRLGSQLAVTQTRQDFTKQMVNTLKVGADNLVNADLNEEGANLLALNTQQQLSQQALSLATQSSQSVLQLLRG